MWESHWGVIPSVQNLKAKLLLANYESRLHEVCSKMRPMLMIFTHLKSTSRGANHYDQPLTIRGIENRPNGIAPQGKRQRTIRHGSY